MQEKLEGSKVTLESVKESLYNFKDLKNNAESVYQFPRQFPKMITPAKDIEFITSLYPYPLRTLHTVFRLDLNGAIFPFFLHSQVAFALIQIS
jgi:hypothetical protein